MTPEQLEMITERKRAFQLAFKSPAGEAVMRELAKYCRVYSTTAHETPNLTFVFEGRRQVYLRIQQYLESSVESLHEMFNVRGDYDG